MQRRDFIKSVPAILALPGLTIAASPNHKLKALSLFIEASAQIRQDGHKYYIISDPYSPTECYFKIFDVATSKEVTSFGILKVTPQEFTQILNEVSIYYNNAWIVVDKGAYFIKISNRN